MAIIYNFDEHGGFMAADTQTRRSSYAYPTSTHAKQAKANAVAAAREMMKSENEMGDWRDAKTYREADERRIRSIADINIKLANG